MDNLFVGKTFFAEASKFFTMKSLKMVSVGTSDILKFALYRNWYYNRKKIYRKFIHVKDMPCQVSGMTLGLSRSGKYREFRELTLAITSIG